MILKGYFCIYICYKITNWFRYDHCFIILEKVNLEIHDMMISSNQTTISFIRQMRHLK